MIYRIDGNILRADDTVFRYDGFLNGHDGDILSMDHNGDLLATGSADKTVKIWSGVSLNVFRTTAEQQVSLVKLDCSNSSSLSSKVVTLSRL